MGLQEDNLDYIDRLLVIIVFAGVLAIAAFILQGCGGDDHTTYISEEIVDEENPYEEAVKNGIYVPDANITDIITATNVESATISDSGLQIICVQGSTCTVTIDNSTNTDSYNQDNSSTDSHDIDDNSITNP